MIDWYEKLKAMHVFKVFYCNLYANIVVHHFLLGNQCAGNTSPAKPGRPGVVKHHLLPDIDVQVVFDNLIN